MMKNAINYPLVLAVPLFTSCEDVETKVTLYGKVHNYATDQGLGGVPVHLYTIYKNQVSE